MGCLGPQTDYDQIIYLQLLMHQGHIECKRYEPKYLQGIMHGNKIDKSELEFC